MPVRTVQVGDCADRRLLVPAATDKEAIQKAFALLADWPAPWKNTGTGVRKADLKVIGVQDNHHAVGRTFRPPFSEDGTSCTCIAYDWRTGFWMEFQDGSRRDVSERAIGRTYHRIREDS